MGRGGAARTLTVTETNHISIDYGATKGPASPEQKLQGGITPSLLENEAAQPTINKWLTLVIAIAVGLVAGSLYGFGRYSRDLRDTLETSQMTVQRFGILLDSGNYFGHPLTGWVYDRFGPRKSCLAAAFIVFVSFGSIHLGLFSAPIWMIDLGFLGVGFGSGLGYIAGLGSTSSAFASTPHLGRAVAMVSAGYGLSSTVVGCTYRYTGIAYFFLLWAFLVAIVNIVGAYVFVLGSDQHASEEHVVIEDSPNDDLAITCKDLESCRLLEETSDATILSGDTEVCCEWNSWKRIDFWLLFESFACITGCGLMIINNISTMVQSLGGDDSLAGALVVGLSICNVLGRILMGSLADHPKLHKLDLYRYASLIMALALLVSAVGGTSLFCLCVTVAFAAMAYGGSWVLMIGIIGDVFGKDDFGKDYGLIAMGPAISGMIFNLLSAHFYESHATDSKGVCIGAVCYRDAFFLAAASATTGYLILLWLLPVRCHDEEDEDPSA